MAVPEHFLFDLEGAVLFPGSALRDEDGHAVNSYMAQGRTTFFSEPAMRLRVCRPRAGTLAPCFASCQTYVAPPVRDARRPRQRRALRPAGARSSLTFSKAIDPSTL